MLMRALAPFCPEGPRGRAAGGDAMDPMLRPFLADPSEEKVPRRLPAVSSSSAPCAIVLHSPRFWRLLMLACAGSRWAVGRRLVGKLAAMGATADPKMAVVGRLRHDSRTRTCVERRTRERLSEMKIIRCLKLYLAREVYRSLCADLHERQA